MARKPRILVVGPAPPQIGGMETFVGALMQCRLGEEFDLRLHNITKPFLKKSGRFTTKVGYGASLWRNPVIAFKSYFYSILFLTRFIHSLTKSEIDIVHIHTASYTSFWEKVFYIFAAKVFREKVVLHIHGALFREFIQRSRVLLQKNIKAVLRWCDAVIVLSANWKNFFHDILPQANFFVVENGINLKEIRPVSSPVDWDLIYLGEVGWRKGIYDLIDAMSILEQKNIHCSAVIVGPGEIERAQDYAAEKGIASQVTFAGPQYGVDKFQYLQRASIFVLPSFAEGFPMAILEAMAAGLPIVSTHVGGIPDMIRQGENGFLFDPGDVQALVHIIESLLKDADLIKKISMTNRMAAREYDIDVVADKIGKIYSELLATSA
jgi:glycosyltransferase involved in cell wall biosynthesis